MALESIGNWVLFVTSHLLFLSPSLCPQSLLPLLPARSPQKQLFLKGKGSPPGRRPPGAGPAAPREGGGSTEGAVREGAGPSLGAPLPASPEHLSPASWSCPHRSPGPRGQWNSRDSLPAEGLGPHEPRALAKVGALGCGHGHTTLQLPAHHVGSGQVQVSVTDGAPGQATPHLQAPSTGVPATRQPGLRVPWRRRKFHQ